MLVKFEQNRMIEKIQTFEFFGKKMVDHFWEIVGRDSYDKTIVWCKNNNFKIIIFQCSKIYGIPTRVTRLILALKMAIPVSPNEKGLYP